LLQLNSINNSNGTVLQKMLTVINYANVFYLLINVLTLTQATEGIIYPQGGFCKIWFLQNLIHLSAECDSCFLLHCQ